MFFYHQGSGKELQTKFVVLVKSLETLSSWSTTSPGCRLPLPLDPHLADRHSLFRGGAPQPEEGEVIALLGPNDIGKGILTMDRKVYGHHHLHAVSTPAVETTQNGALPTEISGQLVLPSPFISKRAGVSWPVSGAWGFPCPEHGNGVG